MDSCSLYVSSYRSQLEEVYHHLADALCAFPCASGHCNSCPVRGLCSSISDLSVALGLVLSTDCELSHFDVLTGKAVSHDDD